MVEPAGEGLPIGQVAGEHGNGFGVAHGFDIDRLCSAGQGVYVAGGDEVGGAWAAAEKRFGMGRVPEVIDDQEALFAGQGVCQFRGGGVLVDKAGVDVGQVVDEVVDFAGDVVGVLAEFDPEDAVGKGGLDVGVVAESLGQGGFAEAARPVQGGS